MKPTILKKAKRFITKVSHSGIPVTRAYIFGSYAKNTQHRWSDIDICIVSPKLGKDVFDEMTMLKNIADPIDERIEIHPFSEKGINNRYSTLATEIKKYGVVI